MNALLQACMFKIERLMRLAAHKKSSFLFVWDSADRDTDILDNIYTLSILSTVACNGTPWYERKKMVPMPTEHSDMIDSVIFVSFIPPPPPPHPVS